MPSSPQGGNTEGERGALERGLNGWAGAPMWSRPWDTSVKSRVKSGGHGMPPGEVQVEKCDTAVMWCEQGSWETPGDGRKLGRPCGRVG